MASQLWQRRRWSWRRAFDYLQLLAAIKVILTVMGLARLLWLAHWRRHGAHDAPQVLTCVIGGVQVKVLLLLVLRVAVIGLVVLKLALMLAGGDQLLVAQVGAGAYLMLRPGSPDAGADAGSAAMMLLLLLLLLVGRLRVLPMMMFVEGLQSLAAGRGCFASAAVRAAQNVLAPLASYASHFANYVVARMQRAPRETLRA